MPPNEVKVNEWLVEGFYLYKSDFGRLTGAGFLAILIGGLTGGLLAGPMILGLIHLILKDYDQAEPRPGVLGVFQGFRRLIPAVGFFVVLGLILAGAAVVLHNLGPLGQIGAILLYLLAACLFLFAPFLMMDRRLGAVEAVRQSVGMVKPNFKEFISFGAIVAALGLVGGAFCGLGLVVTLPLELCMIAVAYRELFSGVETQREALVGERAPLDLGLDKKEAPASQVWEVDEKDMTGEVDLEAFKKKKKTKQD